MLSVLQIFLLIITTLLFHISITNPNSRSTSDYIPSESIDLTLAVSCGPAVGKFIIWLMTLYQIFYLYLQISSSSLLITFFPQISSSINLLSLTPLSLLGYILMIIGGLGRIWCFRTLGKFFTFELRIRHSHQLITTGPYAYVRHPSYTFIFILLIGMFLVHQRLAAFFPKSSSMQLLFNPIGILLCCLLVIILLQRRIIGEEKELKKTFGKEWIEYASKTKRYIPGVI